MPQHREMRSLTQALMARLDDVIAWLEEYAQPSTLQLTGVVGLAIFLYGLYHLRASANPPAQPPTLPASRRKPQEAQAADQPSTSGATHSRHTRTPTQGAAQAGSVQAQLKGIRSITVSAPGVLLEEWTSTQLAEDGATPRPEAVRILADMTRFAAVSVLAHVEDDVGEAAVRGALEAAGLVGEGPGQIRAHRLLFCSTLEGKVSIVRQLEPQLHVDGHPSTIAALQRFMPQLLYIRAPAAPLTGQTSKNIACADALADVFEIPPN